MNDVEAAVRAVIGNDLFAELDRLIRQDEQVEMLKRTTRDYALVRVSEVLDLIAKIRADGCAGLSGVEPFNAALSALEAEINQLAGKAET